MIARQRIPRRHRFVICGVLTWLLVSYFFPTDRPLPDSDTFLKEVFKKIRDWEKNPPRPQYDEHRVTTDYRGDREKDKREEVYRITWYRGRPVYVQLKVNDRIRSQGELDRDAAAKRAAIDKELANPSSKEKITIVALSPILDKFDFELVSREILDGVPMIKVRFQPITDKFTKKTNADRILKQTCGFAWIDEREKELVKVESAIASPIKLGWGILGSINVLTLDYQRKKRENNQWFVDSLRVRVKVRILFFTKYNRLVESRNLNLVWPESSSPE